MKVPSWLRLLLLSPSVLAIAVATRLLLMANLDPMVAMKIATTGGLVGTLVGTIVPLLPPFLPLFVVWLVIGRRYFLALLAALSTVLISPAKVTALEGWRHIYDRGLTFFSDQYTQPALWGVAALAALAALASPPKSLRWVPEEELFKKVDDKVRKHETEDVEIVVPIKPPSYETGNIHTRFVPKPYTAANPQQRREWRAGLLLDLRSEALEQRRRTVKWRAFSVLVVAAVCVPVVGAIAQFYIVPAAGSDPAFIVRRPWVPPEVLSTKSGRLEVGYVLATADKWFTVLAEKDRTIHYLAADDVTRRAVCTLESEPASNPGPLVRLRGVTGPSSKPCPVPR
jgi:hypothetical protein